MEQIGYVINFSDFWNKMLSAEVSFSTGIEFVAQRVHSHVSKLNSDKVDYEKFGLNELTHIAISLEELSKNIKNGIINYIDCQNEFNRLMISLTKWAETKISNQQRTELKFY